KRVLIPIMACAYAEIISPFLLYINMAPREGLSVQAQLERIMAPRIENKIFWPAMAAMALVLLVRNLSGIKLPLHIKWLFAYLFFAGLSVLWSFKIDISAVRFIQQAMIVIAIVLPALLSAPTTDMMRALFLCFALAMILNIFFVLNQTPIILEN